METELSLQPAASATALLQRLQRWQLDQPIRILNVCGGHERSIAKLGLRRVMHPRIELIPGPGCPVCVCPEEDLADVIGVALNQPVTLAAFGDLLRVPANLPAGEPRSLVEARAAGADVRPIASPVEAIALARQVAPRPLVFFAAGFETTFAPVAALLAADNNSAPLPENLLLWSAGRRTWPIVRHLLASGQAVFDALVAPGHVATVMGADEWRFVAEEFRLPVAVAGFHAESLLAALLDCVDQIQAGRATLTNCYPDIVTPSGNGLARQTLAEVFDIVDADWRGIGTIPASGYRLSAAYRHRDARTLVPASDTGRRRRGEMPPGCGCAKVVLGQIYPDQCPLYGNPCTPRRPIGPCMVSDEGACRIWWSQTPKQQAEPCPNPSTPDERASAAS